LALAGAFFLAATFGLAAAFGLLATFDLVVTFDFVAAFGLAATLVLASAFGLALLDAVLVVLRVLVEDADAFFVFRFGALPAQGGVAPFSLDSTWVATAINNSPIRF
jgi:hypothetical protein